MWIKEWWDINGEWVFLKVKVAQSSLTLCDRMNYSLPGSSVRGIFQARILEWVAITFSRESSWPRIKLGLLHWRCFLYSLSHQESGLSSKEPACQCKKHKSHGFNPKLGRCPGEGNGDLLQYSAWRIVWTEKPGGLQSMDRKESDTTEVT